MKHSSLISKFFFLTFVFLFFSSQRSVCVGSESSASSPRSFFSLSSDNPAMVKEYDWWCALVPQKRHELWYKTRARVGWYCSQGFFTKEQAEEAERGMTVDSTGTVERTLNPGGEYSNRVPESENKLTSGVKKMVVLIAWYRPQDGEDAMWEYKQDWSGESEERELCFMRKLRVSREKMLEKNQWHEATCEKMKDSWGTCSCKNIS